MDINPATGPRRDWERPLLKSFRIGMLTENSAGTGVDLLDPDNPDDNKVT